METENILRTEMHAQLAPDMQSTPREPHGPASECTAGQEFTGELTKEVTRDTVAKLTSRNGGCAPAEIRIRGHIQHPSQIDGNEVEAILDLGAGKSYLLVGHDFNYIPTEELQGNLEVLFADNSTCSITETVSVDLTVFALDGETEFRRSRVTLYVIRTSQSATVTEPLRLLLGRNLMVEYKLDVYSAQRAMIGNTVLYESNKGKVREPDSINLMEDPIGPHDRLNWLRSMVHLDILEGMPRALIDDTCEGEPDELTAEDVAEIQDRMALEPSEVRVTIGESDVRAPWGRLYVTIPWKGTERPGRNYKLAWTRDQVIGRRLSPEQAALYADAIKTMTEGGFAQWSTRSTQPDKHFIACRPLFKENRTSTRCRICLDAREINRHTLTGSVLSPPVLECLLRFRATRWVALYDLDKAFWQIKLEDDEVGWYTTVVNGEQLQFTRMIFGANYSPSGLETAVKLIDGKAREWLATSTKYADDEPPRPTPTFAYHNYVDDFCHTNAIDRNALLQEAAWFRWFLSRYGFTSSKFLNNVEAHEQEVSQSYLGYKWILPADALELRIPAPVTPPKECTTSDVVAIVAKLYDPLGLALKAQLHGRMIVRGAFEATKTNGQPNAWKREVPADVVRELETWSNELQAYASITPRYVSCDTLNVFADASQTCWAYEVRGSDFDVMFSRGGLTAARSTIPRNELIALHEAVKDVAEAIKFLAPRRIFFFADSECTVFRIRNKTKTPPFEARRLKTIRETLLGIPATAEVLHLPGDLNPADFPTRPRAKGERPSLDKQLLRAYQTDPTIPRVTQRMLAGRDLEELEKQEATSEGDDFGIGRTAVHLMQLRQRKPKHRQTEAREETQDKDTSTGEQEQEQEQEENKDFGTEWKERQARIRTSQERFITIDDQVQDDVTIDPQGLLRKNERVIIPDQDIDLIREILERIHNRGHPGITQTRQLTKRDYFIRNLQKHVKRYVADCEICAQIRGNRAVRTVAGEAMRMKDLEKIPVAAIVGIDVAVVQALEEGEPSCFITAVCALTKWVRTEPLERQSAEEIVAGLRRIFNRTLYPLVLVMDNATPFRSKLMKKFAVANGIRLCYSPAYASAYCGWIERAHQSILTGLRVLQQHDPSKHWSELLPEAEHLTNSRPLTEDSELSPLHLVFSASTITDPERPAPDIEQLVESAGVAHLMAPASEDFAAYRSRVTARRLRVLKAYESVFNRRRNNIRRRLLRKIRDGTESFPIGSLVHVFRPVACKTRSQWSEPRKVIGVESPSIRVVERSDGRTSREYLANLRSARECSVNGI